MNYKEIFADNKQNLNFRNLLQNVLEDREDFIRIFDLMFDENEKVAWRAAWICEKASERNTEYIDDQLLERIILLAMSTSYTGIQRLTLTMILRSGLPREIPVEFINVCFERMISSKFPVAVQVLSMKLIYEFTKQEPDVGLELLAYLESVDINNYSIGFFTARKNILKRLAKSSL